MIKFSAYGHENILATHKTTLEFTKDKSLTKKGDCIIGINSDLDLNSIKKFIKKIKKKNIKIIIRINNKKEIINCKINKNFNSNREIVIRKSNYSDKRTFAINADKAACDVRREIIKELKNPDSKLEVLITN